MSNHRWLVPVILLLSPLCAASANSAEKDTVASNGRGQFTVDVWESDNGLPQNSVITITQTRDGYLGLGTLRGLVRFD